MTELSAVPMCIKVRRTIRVREFFRAECMRYKMVDASHHRMVDQIFFQTHDFISAIVPKDFTHRTALFLWFHGCCGTGKLAQKIMVKFPQYPRRDRSPGACNGCSNWSRCRFDKYQLLHDRSRNGICNGRPPSTSETA